MSYEEASGRENSAFKELQRAVAERGRFDPKAAIFSDHQEGYDTAVERLLAAVQAYEAASSDLLKARAAQSR
jgi:hypothetical protein